MQNVFILIEHNGSVADDSAMELATAAHALVGDSGTVTGLLTGHNCSRVAEGLTGWFDEIRVWDDEQLATPDGEATAALCAPLIQRESPDLVLAAHTNTSMDFIPGMAVRLGRPLLTDCVSLSIHGDGLSAVRPAYGGKIHVRVSTSASASGVMATVRPGSIRPGSPPRAHTEVKAEDIPDALAVRRRFLRTVSGDAADIDISMADRLVAVGRGIEDEEGLDMIRSLAEALGAEIACSRPVVDKQWLPKSRQVGTSGKSVRPKIYIAIGISGSFQHMGGIKGDPFLVAINKDPRAPIFDVADVGIVGDLFDVVPALEAKIRTRKA